ncbi:MAG: helicase-related protein [Pseudomonadota bacterium]
MSDLKAVLGPTNTGKTHYAIERMMGYSSGMIGLPLRLLAREVYDRIRAIKGDNAVALITGEERIWPASARYFACTVEAMPVQVPVECLAIDEIQLAEDPDRGHIFTDRLLHARGIHETLFLGAETMAPILRALDLPAEGDARSRFSELHYSGPVKTTKLPKRSAVIAFSSEEVYAIGELLRRQKGGAAIIMGALSPRTRNAQVALYQSGEVDYLVATDAVGMGLNLDVDHVAFASSTKFDGQRQRRLRAAEMGQIAGRAGRFRSDGSFGETGDCPAFEDELVARIVNHTFDPVDRLEWRNSDLDISTIHTLMRDLAKPSGTGLLRQNPNALDEWTLRRFAVDQEIAESTNTKEKTRRLWDLCRLPDFRKAGHEGHFRLVQTLHEILADPDARLSDDDMANRLERLSSPVGDIPTLQNKLAAIRTWTYAAHRDDWLANPGEWRNNTRLLEDELSDALHEALTERFVDRRTTALLAGLKKEKGLMADIGKDGEIQVEGHVVGHLKGLIFEPVSAARTLEGKAIRNAALSALEPILAARLANIASAKDEEFSLSEKGEIAYQNDTIACLIKGSHWLNPGAELVGAAQTAADLRSSASNRIGNWLSDQVAKQLPSLTGLGISERTAGLTGTAKGFAFRLQEAGAAIDLRQDDQSVRVEAEDREALKALGVRVGRVSAHIPDAQKPAAQKMIALLRSVYDGTPCPLAPEGAGSFEPDAQWNHESLAANGYVKLGKRAIRADLAERLAWEVSKRRRESESPSFALPPELASVVSCPGDAFPDVIKGLGLAPAEKDPETGVPTLWRFNRRNRPDRSGQNAAGKQNARKSKSSGNAEKRAKKHAGKHRSGRRAGPDPSSPFAALATLIEPSPSEKSDTNPDSKAPKPDTLSPSVSNTSE